MISMSFHINSSVMATKRLKPDTCMMNRIMGFDALYWLGSKPSRTPPCGVTLSAAVEVDDVTAVTVCVTIEAAIIYNYIGLMKITGLR